MRGFDIFVRVANGIARQMSNVIFICVESDRISYGNDLNHISAKSFREHALATEKPANFRHLGQRGRQLIEDNYSLERPFRNFGTYVKALLVNEPDCRVQTISHPDSVS